MFFYVVVVGVFLPIVGIAVPKVYPILIVEQKNFPRLFIRSSASVANFAIGFPEGCVKEIPPFAIETGLSFPIFTF